MKLVNLRYLRTKYGFSQTEIASRLGITRAAYTNYESGSRQPGLRVLSQLADLYAVSLDELVGRIPTADHEVLMPIEHEVIEHYRQLTPAGRLRVMNQMNFELALNRKEV